MIVRRQHILVLSISGKVLSVQTSGRFGEELLVAPTATERFDELNGGDKALAGELGVGAFGVKGVTARIDHFNVGHDAGTVALRGQIRRGGRWSRRAAAPRLSIKWRMPERLFSTSPKATSTCWR